MGHGRPPIARVLAHGIRPALSVDVETSSPTDMFTQMRAAIQSQRGFAYDDAYRTGNPVAERVTARQALEFATVEGARANGLANRVGTLEPGKQADIVLIRTDHLNTWPVNDPVGAVVSRGGRPDLAGDSLGRVKAATLLIVGSNDKPIMPLNEEAYYLLHCERALRIVPGATHLFEEEGTLERAAEMAAEWFAGHLHPMTHA